MKHNEIYKLYFHGGCNRKKLTTYGWVIEDPTGKVCAKGRGIVARGGDEAKRNVAMYYGLLAGLQACVKIEAGLVVIGGSNHNVIAQVEGESAVSCKSAKPLYQEVYDLLFSETRFIEIYQASPPDMVLAKSENNKMIRAAGEGAYPVPYHEVTYN